ncbi:MAG: arsenosugar biosynthesis radical SAM (seleno)protein ArsS [Cyanobacteria bacterium P01_F01_bin.42]
MAIATVQKSNSEATAQPNFEAALGKPLTKSTISTLQVNLGKRCNLACTHCHVEAGPFRMEEMQADVYQPLAELIRRFDQIESVDLTGGAPEMHVGFKPLVEAASETEKDVIVRSNLTIFYVPGFEEMPEYLTEHQAHIVASLPCYLEENVDKMRGNGVFDNSIKALQALNALGYGRDPNLRLDLVYNPPLPKSPDFSLTPDQIPMEQAYKKHLKANFGIVFNQLFTITNIPIGRTKFQLDHRQLLEPYLSFLSRHYNPQTVPNLMCRKELSIDYNGNIYDCDFNQMENLPALTADGNLLTVQDLLDSGTLDVIRQVQTRPYCFGCTAGSGSSCGGSLVEETMA